MSECKHKPVERVGLYIMVFITMVASCSAQNDISSLYAKQDKVCIENSVEITP
jgi:hypothetical protein